MPAMPTPPRSLLSPALLAVLLAARAAAHDPISTSGNQVGQQSVVVVKLRGFTGASLTRDYSSIPETITNFHVPAAQSSGIAFYETPPLPQPVARRNSFDPSLRPSRICRFADHSGPRASR